jgi:NAD(P)-dependent dehydrogenase (short-subunit alcohol dehydrogenase family)
VNVLSGVRLSRHHLPRMKTRNWGRIIFVSSESALQIHHGPAVNLYIPSNYSRKNYMRHAYIMNWCPILFSPTPNHYSPYPPPRSTS